MWHLRHLFIMCFVACSAEKAAPFLDLPEELLMDVNKAYATLFMIDEDTSRLMASRPHPIVNVIIDQVTKHDVILRYLLKMVYSCVATAKYRSRASWRVEITTRS